MRWDRYQELVFKAQLAATGRGVRKQVVFIPPNEVVNKEIEKGITEGQSKAKIAKQVRKELTLVLGENRAKNVTEAIGDNDFYAVNCFLKKTIDGQLKEDLGHELKHAKDNPPTFRTKGFTWFLPKFGSFLTTAFIIMQTRSLELGDKDVYGSLISAGFAYGVFETMNRSAAICAYWLDPYEVHARACGEKVRKDSQWASLINTKGQWF